ncbi:hypothetical protein BH11PSE4_BH11PSE4_26040 [soil metagenome]
MGGRGLRVCGLPPDRTAWGHPGYATLTAADAATAMIIINGPLQIDRLFTDMIMPGSMTGLQLAYARCSAGPR